jgi:ABC-2 type transport system ATP-binding protein
LARIWRILTRGWNNDCFIGYGFIGRNGAGKTTTLKSLLNLVHPNSGGIMFFGKNFKENEFEIKQKIGFVTGGIDYYPKKKIKTITSTTRRFYKNWEPLLLPYL